MDDFTRQEPAHDADEKTALTLFLDYHRATLLWKVDGVSDQDLRRPMVPSGVSLLGLVKHLGYVERWWFQFRFADAGPFPVPWSEDDPDADFRVEPGEATAEIVDFYKQQCRLSRQISAAASLDDRARREGCDHTLRWIMLHMIEETARHNGHADIFREEIDGSTGE